MKPKRAAVLALVGVIAGVLTSVALDLGRLRVDHPSKARFPVRGVDVSHHRGEIDWELVRRAGVAFAYVKATEGGDLVDRLFRRNWSRGRAAGLAVGAYHFFSFCRDGASQARNFLATVPKAPGTLPPAVDLELVGNCAVVPTPNAFRRQLAAFLEQLRHHYGREPVLYLTREIFERYFRSGTDLFRSHPLWVRDVSGEPEWVAGRAWTFWQYSDRGRIAGISGPVDLDVFNGDLSKWARFREPLRVSSQN